MNKVNYNFQFVDPSMIEETKRKCGESHYEENSLVVNVIDNAYVLPCVDCWKGGIEDERGTYYEHSFIHRGVGGAYDFDKTNVEFCDEEVVYIGMLHSVWGHWITDNLKHLWFLFDERYSDLKSKKFIYTPLDPAFKFSGNALSLLGRLGIKEEDLYRIDRITKFKKVFLPDDCFIRWDNKGCWYTSGYKVLIDNIIQSNKGSSSGQTGSFNEDERKVYLTRTRLKSYKDIGEERIEKVFKDLGFRIVSPELMTFDEQLDLLGECDVVAATEGSVTHNAVFMKEGSELVIVRKRNFVNEYQLAINEMKALRVTYIDSHKSTMLNKKFSFTGPFFMYCSKNLSRYAQCRKPFFPVFSYLSYVWNNRPDRVVKKVLKRLKTKCHK